MGVAWGRGHLARSLLLLDVGRDARAPRNTRFQRVGAAQAEVSQRADGLVPDDAGVVENLLKFGGCRSALTCRQVSFSTQVDGVEGKTHGLGKISQLIGRRRQRIDGLISVFGRR